MQRAGMFCNYTLFLFISWLSVAGALSLSFPPSGTPTAGFDSQTVSWKRDGNDPKVQFYLQKIKLDDPDGPTAKSTPVPIPNSENGAGTSPMTFNRAGLFEIIAVNIQNGQPFYTTEFAVVPNPTSTGGAPPPTSSSHSGNNQGGKNGMNVQTTTSNSSATSAPSAPDSASATSATPAPPNHTVIIIGGVVGGVGFLFLVGVILLCLRYRTRRATSNFVRSKMVRNDLPEGRWTILGSEKERDVEYYNSSVSPTRRSSLRPQDSVSSIGIQPYALPIVPPIPAARSVAGSDVPSSVSSSSSARRTRERNAPRLSISTLSTSTSAASGSLFPIPSLPPRTRTDRQMLIEEDIQRLQARMLFLQGRGDISPISRLEREEELKQIHTKVDRLKTVHESRWALGLTDDVPEGFF